MQALVQRVGDAGEGRNVQRFAANGGGNAASRQKLRQLGAIQIPKARGQPVQKKSASFLISAGGSCVCRRTTALVTFGCGMKQLGGTSNSSSGAA